MERWKGSAKRISPWGVETSDVGAELEDITVSRYGVKTWAGLTWLGIRRGLD
jgi:hypothetical protein